MKCQTNSELNRNNEGITVLALPSSSLLQQLMQCNAINSQVSLIVREPCMLLSYKGIIQDRQSQDFCLFTSFAARMLLFLSAILHLITSSIPSVVVNKEVLKYSFSTKLHKQVSKRDIKWRCIDMVTASLRMCTYA